VKGNNPDGDTMTFSKIDARTYEAVTKKDGKTTLTARIVVAADGKTRITTQAGKNGRGETVKNTMFYEKQ
jgi:flavin-dependent dehydrogenase